VQKLLVAATTQSYFRPHRHTDKSEFALVLRGQFVVFNFDDQGNITGRQRIGEGSGVNGLELAPNTWHCWLALSDDAVFFETKQGPYDPATASEFAPWAPAENTPEAATYLAMLREAI
jgi:cupin fold WbuC family metalloprotein